MLNVEWRTGVGYGDFVTGLGYAHGASIKYQVPVNIKFHWKHSKEYLFHPTDPETIVERCDYIHSIMRPLPDVTVEHVYDSEGNFRFYNQLDEWNPLHGLWYTSLRYRVDPGVVAIWTTEHNIDHPGTSKDPSVNHWQLIREKLKLEGYTVVDITYRTPVKEAIEIIRCCDFGIGYDGLAHQLFKFMWKPLIVICKRHALNKILIPQACLIDKPDHFLAYPTKLFVDISKQNVEQVRIKHQKYLDEKRNCYEHKLYNTFIY